jgi:hypothetical protein
MILNLKDFETLFHLFEHSFTRKIIVFPVNKNNFKSFYILFHQYQFIILDLKIVN